MIWGALQSIIGFLNVCCNVKQIDFNLQFTINNLGNGIFKRSINLILS